MLRVRSLAISCYHKVIRLDNTKDRGACVAEHSVNVHPRVMRCHPDISEQDVLYAFQHIIRSMRRSGDHEPTQYLRVGTTSDRRVIEMLAVISEQHEWFVYHAMRVTNKALRELNLL